MSAVAAGTPIQEQVRDFTIGLLDATGGMVDWNEPANEGMALASPELSQCLGQPTEEFILSTDASRPGLCLSLGGEFIELADKALHQFVPARGSFKLLDLPVKKSDYQQAIDSAFGWQNARARVKQGVITDLAYHAWWFHVALQADDAWESLIQTTINSESLLPIELGDILGSMDLTAVADSATGFACTTQAAARQVEMQAMKMAEPFFARADQRLLRDRKRLREYYAAMLRESATPNRRTKIVPSPEEIDSRQRAVKLELKRKLAELDDRYSIDATIRPVALAMCRVPVVAIEVEVQRKSATRLFRIFWNGLTRRVEPLACSICQTGKFNFWFANDTVEPICNTCHTRSQASNSAKTSV